MPPPHQILLVEDDPLIARTLSISLRHEGFVLTVATDSGQAQKFLDAGRFDLVIFDVGLPDGSGIELCRTLRARDAEVPILLLSARTDESTVVAGIKSGADDYIRKPFGLHELNVRMQRLLKRSSNTNNSRQTASFGPISMDLQRHEAAVNGVLLRLGNKEFEALLLLVRANGDVITREQIVLSFSDDSEISDRTIDSHLSHLRKKLKEADAAVRIVAVYGIGYRLEAA